METNQQQLCANRGSGRYTGDLAFYNELMVIATSAAWGSLSDKIGANETLTRTDP